MTRSTVSRYSLLLCLLLAGPSGATPRPDVAAPFQAPADEADTSALDLPSSIAAGSAWSLMRPTNSGLRQIPARPLVHLEHSPTVLLAQAAGNSEKAAAPVDETEQGNEHSATEINKQLSNPVTSFWSLTFQFNNYDLENGHWNHNMLFQPVLPVSLTEDWNLINRPVIPVYNSVPRPIGPGRFRQTTAFGDLGDVELLSPAHSGGWLLGLGPTFIFPTGSTYTSQGKYQIGPAAVVGYLTKKYIVGLFPQQWWSVSGGSRPPVSQLNLQPFYAYFLPEGWSVGYSGNILANERASTGQMWTVPIGLQLSKVHFLGKLPVKFALAGQYMPVHPSDLGQEWNVQLIITPVIPKLFKGTIF
jgi:hypothetical protein